MPSTKCLIYSIRAHSVIGYNLIKNTRSQRISESIEPDIPVKCGSGCISFPALLQTPNFKTKNQTIFFILVKGSHVNFHTAAALKKCIRLLGRVEIQNCKLKAFFLDIPAFLICRFRTYV